MSNMRVKNLLILFTLLVLAACSDKEEPLEELFLELDASSENVDYGDSSVSYTHLTLPPSDLL